jgi:hypothetical protein
MPTTYTPKLNAEKKFTRHFETYEDIDTKPSVIDADYILEINRQRLLDIPKFSHLSANEETKDLVDSYIGRERRLEAIKGNHEIVHKNKIWTKDDVLNEFKAL